MTATFKDWEDTPSYLDFLKLSLKVVINKYHDISIKDRESSTVIYSSYFDVSYIDILLVVFASIIYTGIRRSSERYLKLLGHRLCLTPDNQMKITESVWKCAYFSCAWCYTAYVVFWTGKYEFLQKPSTVWNGWSLNMRLPMDIYIIYISQYGFYLHAFIATMFIDTWRKDSHIMVVHHITTLISITISLFLKCHNLGTLLFLTHDISEMILEFTKINVYCKIQANQLIKKHEIIANISFMLFTVVWYIGRLYWFPLRVLYSAMDHGLQVGIPYDNFMVCLLWFILIMDCYWTFYIAKILLRITTGQDRNLNDIREYDQETMYMRKKHNLSSKPKRRQKNKDILNKIYS